MNHNKKSFLILLLALCLLAALLLSGCSAKDGQDSSDSTTNKTFLIYRVSPEGDKLVSSSYTPKSTDFKGILREVLDQFCQPSKSGDPSALPDTVKINSTTYGISEIDVDFDSAYLSLGKVPELLLRSALVETLVQFPEVEKVRFTVEGQPLTQDDGKEISVMTKDSFIIPEGDAINSYRKLEFPLYFSSPSGDKLVKVSREFPYSTNAKLERVVAEQIIAGPDADALLPVTTNSVIVLGARVKGDNCLIDFSSAVNDLPAADSPVKPETALYAFVNSICDACSSEGVTGVRFTIEGSSDQRFRGQVNLDQTFKPDPDLVEKGETEADETGASGSLQMATDTASGSS